MVSQVVLACPTDRARASGRTRVPCHARAEADNNNGAAVAKGRRSFSAREPLGALAATLAHPAHLASSPPGAMQLAGYTYALEHGGVSLVKGHPSVLEGLAAGGGFGFAGLGKCGVRAQSAAGRRTGQPVSGLV